LLALGLTDALAFLAVGVLLAEAGLEEDRTHGFTIGDLRGMAYRYPVGGFALTLAILSLAGLPPLAGFVAKWQVFAAGFASSEPLVQGAVIFAVLNTLLAVAYYLPVLMSLFDPTADRARRSPAAPALMRIPLIVLTVLIMIAGLMPEIARWLTSAAGAALVNGLLPGS
jgi:NADH:ubiquinone oxidoreductase subunit 2 (subunit N)